MVSVVGLAESFLHSQIVSDLRCFENICVHWWPHLQLLYVSPTGVFRLPFQTLYNMSKFSSPSALWDLAFEGFSASGDRTAVVPVWDPCLSTWWGSVDSVKLSLGGGVEVGETWGLATCHAPVLLQILLLKYFPLHAGDRRHANWQSTLVCSVVSGE